MNPESFSVTTDDGVRLNGARWPASVPEAPIVLALHGVTANRMGFLPVIEEFAGDVELVAYDARGRGLSDKPKDPAQHGHRRNAEDAAAVLRSLGAGPVVVIGQSMGAWDGLQLAAHHPDLVRALVLGDGGYFRDLGPDEDGMSFATAIMGAGWLDRMSLTFPSRELVLAAFQALPAFQGWWGPMIEEFLNAGMEDVEGGVRTQCTPLAAEVDTRDYFVPAGAPYIKADLGLVRCPVHLIRAEFGFEVSPETHEPMMPESAADGMRALLPQLTDELVAGTNHYSVNFGPAGVAAIAEAVRKALK